MDSTTTENSTYTADEVQQIIEERDYYKGKNQKLRESLKETLDIVDGLLDSTIESKSTIYDFTGTQRTLTVRKTVRQLAYESIFQDMANKITFTYDFPKIHFDEIKYKKAYTLLDDIKYFNIKY
jgi:hypothetical protein